MRRVAVLIALAVPFLVWADDKATRAEQEALSGTWVAIGGEAKGREITKDELPFQWTFKAGGKAIFADRKRGSESHYTYTIDSSKNPKVIDITYEGPVAALKGTRQFGIYKLEKDKLTLCLSSPNSTEKDRPKRFTAKEGRILLMNFERAKAGK